MTPSKTVFYIGPWELSQNINKGALFPNIQLLLETERVKRIVVFLPVGKKTSANYWQQLINNQVHKDASSETCVTFARLRFSEPGSSIFRRLVNFISNRSVLLQHIRKLSPDLIISRGANSALALSVSQSSQIPFVVESFEPHSMYMRQTGTWSAWGLKFWVQRFIEFKVTYSASAVLTVSNGFSRYLVQKGGIDSSRIITSPCWFDEDKFFVDHQLRTVTRKKLFADGRLVGIYVGKFQGIYYSPKVLRHLRHLRDSLSSRLFIVILTDHDCSIIYNALFEGGFTPSDVYVTAAAHEEVNNYLNAADFALSFIKPGPWSFACSAIKHGEYWAAGLPVLVPRRIGDESEWLEVEGVGVFVDFENEQSLVAAASRVTAIINVSGSRERISGVAKKYRGRSQQQQAYRILFNKVLH